MYDAAAITRLLSALHDLAQFRPGADYGELVERLAVVRVVTKGIVARSTEPGPVAESASWVHFQTSYLRTEIKRLNARAPVVSSGGGPKLSAGAEWEYRREQADYEP